MFPCTLIIRADAAAAIGHGHVMRCLALAQAWQDRGGECIFVMAQLISEVEKRLRSEGFEVIHLEASPGSRDDAGRLLDLAHGRDAGWIAVDGYHFGVEYHRTLKNAGHRVLLVDDYGHTGTCFADLVLDQNAGTRESFYGRRAPYTELLLGNRYAMLRREFKPWREWERENPPIARKILVTMGGSDSENLTWHVIKALDTLRNSELETIVLAGASNPHIAHLRDLARSRARFRLEIDARNIPELMAWADLAMSAAGSTCWEMCLLGLPAIVIAAADNQLELARELDREKIAIHIPLKQLTSAGVAANIHRLIVDSDLRREMSVRSRKVVDGRGSARVVAAMKAHEFTLRRANPDDCVKLWEWANDPQVRQASFSSDDISWEEHNRWFRNKIQDEQCLWLIWDDGGSVAASVRVQMTTQTDGEISLAVAPQYRGQGLAPYLLKRAVAHTLTNTSLLRVHALIKTDNSASSSAFENAGFLFCGTTVVRGCDARHYLREREGVMHNNSVDHLAQTVEAV
jgi:UDP-2,4-diacetamido-2,4,6-trideoxy-beta-L-altropyranose hydrolase